MELDWNWQPGVYKILKSTYSSKSKNKDSQLCSKLFAGQIVTILEIEKVYQQNRIRGRLSTGNWISLTDTLNGCDFVIKLQNAITMPVPKWTCDVCGKNNDDPKHRKQCKNFPHLGNRENDIQVEIQSPIEVEMQNPIEVELQKLEPMMKDVKLSPSMEYSSNSCPEMWNICMVFTIGSKKVKQSFVQKLWSRFSGSTEDNSKSGPTEEAKFLSKTEELIDRLQKTALQYTIMKDSEHIYVLLGMQEKDLENWAIKEKYLLRLNQSRAREYGKAVGFILADEKQKDELWKHIWIRIHKNGIERELYDLYHKDPRADDFNLAQDLEPNDPQKSVFSTKDRIALIYQLLLKNEESGGCYLTLDKHIQDPNHPLQQIFALHQKQELKQVGRLWAFCGCCMSGVPEDWIITTIVKNYYGESVGFYCEFELFFIWGLISLLPLSAALTSIFFYNKGSLDSVACVPLFMVFCVWPILFCEGWKRREGELKSLWGTTSLEQTSTLRRPEFVGKNAIDEVTGRIDTVYDKYSRVFRLSISALINFIYLLCVIGITSSLMTFRCAKVSKDPTSLVPLGIGFATSIQVVLFDYIYTVITAYLTVFENHRTESEHENAFIIKAFVIRFLNGFMSLYWLGFIQPYFWPESFKDKEGNSLYGKKLQDRIMVDLAMQTFFLFSSLLVVNNTQELLVPRIQSWLQRKMSNEDVKSNIISKQSNKAPYSTTRDDMSEVVMVYGYVSLFIFANPLLPFLGILFALMEWYVDRNKFLKVYQRPFPKGRNGIGAWKQCLKIFAYISIVTNMALLTWRTSQISYFFGSQYKLSFFIIVSLFVISCMLFLEHIIDDVSEKTSNRVKRQVEMERALIFDEPCIIEATDYKKSNKKLDLNDLPKLQSFDKFSVENRV